jgi:predicted GTPase
MLFISALEGKNIQKAIHTTVSVHDSRAKRVPTSDLNKFFQNTFNYAPENSVSEGVLCIYLRLEQNPRILFFFTKKLKESQKIKKLNL